MLRKIWSFLYKFVIFIVCSAVFIAIVFGVFVVLPTTYRWEHGYNYYDIPVVRSCQVDADCQPFASSCVNNDFKPYPLESPFQVSLASFHHDFECECKSYIIMNMCSKK